jgi:hypothetical protein
VVDPAHVLLDDRALVEVARDEVGRRPDQLDAAGVRLTPLAKLSAVAPTALQMMGLAVPPEMTTPSLLAGKEPWSKTALNV